MCPPGHHQPTILAAWQDGRPRTWARALYCVSHTPTVSHILTGVCETQSYNKREKIANTSILKLLKC